jgi:membrane-bound lytic murein transglycosylase D
VMTEEIFLARQAARLEQLNKQKEVTKAASSVEMKKMNPATGNPPAKSSPKNSTIEHTVQKGETLYSIARKYRVTVSDLIDANQLNGTTLKVGKILVILTDKAKSSTGQQNPIYHVVQKGDTLWDISRKYGLSVDKIKKVNNIKGNSLKTGMKILISG